MKRTIEISASFTGVISTGSYENEKPFYSLKEVIEFSNPEEIQKAMDEGLFDMDSINERQKSLHKMCYDQFQQQAETAYQDRIAKQFENIRFYPGKNNLKYPSVTSIIGWDDDFGIPQDELAQYAARGTIIHKQVEIFLATGEWKEPKEVPEIYPELVIVKKGNKELQLDDVDFRGFFKDYPFKPLEQEKTVLNHEHRYGGRADIKCIIESKNKGKWEKIDGIIYDKPTILDVKTGGLNKTKGLKQQTAYAKCEPDVVQVGLIHLNKTVKCGYSKPVMEADLDKYWSLFLSDRDKFKKRYGL
jgi:hypothetical protein